MSAALAAAIKREARARGFALAGIASPEPSEHMDFYRAWLDAGRHGEMGYLARDDSVRRRADLTTTLAEVRSVVVVADEYHSEDPEGVPDDPGRGVIARYARGEDYHDVLKAKLVALALWIDQHADAGAIARAYVDTGPILERELARRAGLGWFGRNTMLIHPRRGSYFFLGLLLLDIHLPADEPFREDRCGTCRACLDACPTGALLGRDERGAPVMDARRCISYLTIELRGSIPRELRRLMGNRIFGCDICQEVCPWNERFARPPSEMAYGPRTDLDGPGLITLGRRLLRMDEQAFREAFRGSPVKRARRSGLLRNVCVALGNLPAASDESTGEAVAVLRDALQDGDPLVREHAAWALERMAR